MMGRGALRKIKLKKAFKPYIHKNLDERPNSQNKDIRRVLDVSNIKENIKENRIR